MNSGLSSISLKYLQRIDNGTAYDFSKCKTAAETAWPAEKSQEIPMELQDAQSRPMQCVKDNVILSKAIHYPPIPRQLSQCKKQKEQEHVYEHQPIALSQAPVETKAKEAAPVKTQPKQRLPAQSQMFSFADFEEYMKRRARVEEKKHSQTMGISFAESMGASQFFSETQETEFSRMEISEFEPPDESGQLNEINETYVIERTDQTDCNQEEALCDDQIFITISEFAENESHMNITHCDDLKICNTSLCSPLAKRHKRSVDETLLSPTRDIDEFAEKGDSPLGEKDFEPDTIDLFTNSEEIISHSRPQSQFKFMLTPPDERSDFEDDVDDLNDSSLNFEKNESAAVSLANSYYTKEKSKEYMGQSVDDMEVDEVLKCVERKIVTIDTSYRTQFITKTTETVINTFYKAQESVNVSNDVKNQLDKIMEPSLEYIMHKNEMLTDYVVGAKEDQIDMNEDDDNDDPFKDETDEDMRISFYERPTFVCSTPEKDDDKDLVVAELNDLDKAFVGLEFENDIAQIEKMSSQKVVLTEELANRYENSQEQFQYSELTHVSYSGPHEPREPEFDINQVFDLSACPELEDGAQAESPFEPRISEHARINSLLQLSKFTESADQTIREQSM
jgi:hypothetical protein